MNAPPATDPAETPVTELKGVGPALAEKLARLGLHTLQDLLFHLPLRYEDRTRVHPIGTLREGSHVMIEGEVLHAEQVQRRRRMLLVTVGDGSGRLTLRFFHFSQRQRQGFRAGERLRAFGEVRRGPTGLEMVHPEYRLFGQGEPLPLDDRLTPVYPATEGVQQPTLRRLTDLALAQVAAVAELLPAGIAGPWRLADALRYVHRPPPDADTALLAQGRHPAQQRLAFEELLAHQLGLLQLRHSARHQPAPPIRPSGALSEPFLAALPFRPTAAQRRVTEEILHDLARPWPMLRLVQGDVGSGKTLVAALACLAAVEAGQQAAVMAPTEILAEQHYQTLSQWFLPLGVQVAWLSGRQRSAERRRMRELLAGGTAAVAVGTHALFQEDIAFHRLGLVVIDEQHRFGVHQRLALRQKGERDGLQPHQLIMTATPIPRTLAMTAYADLDVSVIDELPPGRQPVTTVALSNARRDEVVAHVAEACRGGQQCYWVCTLVEESEALQAEAAEATRDRLQAALPDLRIGLVHGRMKPADKEAVMRAFKARELDLLVATTVIEVGVDVPNASLMIIENAERLGLSQLHQLRGRIGRGTRRSHCVLLYQPPLSDSGRRRLQAMRETSDGFRIAEIDLELRGPGELLGTRQTGLLQLRVADLGRDAALVPRVTQAARRLLAERPADAERLIRRWLGDRLRYRQV